MATPATVVTAEEYERISLAEPDRLWELHAGRLVEKPPMSMRHDTTQWLLVQFLGRQLDPNEYVVQGSARLRIDAEHYFVPDIGVVPRHLFAGDEIRMEALNLYRVALPLVVEVRSPSTERYDLTTKIPAYERQGHGEIWWVHPVERSITARRRREDGSYDRSTYRSGLVHPATLPGVEIALEALFV